jgi:hypothetical protein
MTMIVALDICYLAQHHVEGTIIRLFLQFETLAQTHIVEGDAAA